MSNGDTPISNGYAPTSNGHGATGNGHMVGRQSTYQPKHSLPWLEARVFYIRISRCEIDDSAPEFLTVNHIPLDADTLLEVNGVRTSMYSDGATTLLRRDRLDKRSEEATFVSTDSIRMTGSVKFEVLNKDGIVLSGVLELCNTNGSIGETDHDGQRWSISYERNIIGSIGFFKAKQFTGSESAASAIEVYIAGSFLVTPIILTKTLQLSPWKKNSRIQYPSTKQLMTTTIVILGLLIRHQKTWSLNQITGKTACTTLGHILKVKMESFHGLMLV